MVRGILRCGQRDACETEILGSNRKLEYDACEEHSKILLSGLELDELPMGG